MMPLKILVGIDFSQNSRRALARALAWAVRAPVELHLTHVEADLDGRASSEPGVMAHALAELERATAAELPGALAGGSAIRHHVVQGRPPDTLVELARAHEVDVIALGTRGQTSLGRPLLGSVTEEVVRRADRPVLTVRPGVAPAAGGRRVLCAVDLSTTSRAALLAAAGLARCLGDELVRVTRASRAARSSSSARTRGPGSAISSWARSPRRRSARRPAR